MTDEPNEWTIGYMRGLDDVLRWLEKNKDDQNVLTMEALQALQGFPVSAVEAQRMLDGKLGELEGAQLIAKILQWRIDQNDAYKDRPYVVNPEAVGDPDATPIVNLNGYPIGDELEDS